LSAEAVAKVGTPRIPQCRDPDDRMFLRLADAARVQALVTGDKDLLALARKSRIRIQTPDTLRTETRR
jgi:predicted nucleic acid-binding protein